MPDQRGDVRGRPSNIKVSTVLGKQGRMVSQLGSQEIWELVLVVVNPLGHDVQWFGASVSSHAE